LPPPGSLPVHHDVFGRLGMWLWVYSLARENSVR